MTKSSLALAICLLSGWASADEPNRPRVREIDVVLALDTSSSMSGLIEATRAKLWDVVSLLGKAQPRPIVRVGIISFGNRGYSRAHGWVRTDINLTTDLDAVYGRLFALRTGGSEEYVARAVQVATREMSWSKAQDALRIVFVAGNESATQDPLVTLEAALAEARQHRIFVNSIYCGAAHKGEGQGWARLAALGKGQFAAIDAGRAVAVATPHDEELRRLSAELNKTYLPYGESGGSARSNQDAQDENALRASAPAAASRAVAKAGPLYRADSWDLVDAVASGKVDVAHMPVASAPAAIATLPPAARVAVVELKGRERQAIQRRIATVGAERDAYLAAPDAAKKGVPARPISQKPKASTTSMDDALTGSLKQTAESAGFRF